MIWCLWCHTLSLTGFFFFLFKAGLMCRRAEHYMLRERCYLQRERKLPDNCRRCLWLMLLRGSTLIQISFVFELSLRHSSPAIFILFAENKTAYLRGTVFIFLALPFRNAPQLHRHFVLCKNILKIFFSPLLILADSGFEICQWY